MNDLMIDIETLDILPNAVITQVGACFFDRYTGEIGETFLGNIQPSDCIKQGLSLGWDTIKWWMQQPKENWTWMENPVKLTRVLSMFSTFAKPCETIWAHATFDFPILMNAYRTIGMKLPYHYRACRDIRTLVDLSNLDYNKEKIDKTHNALDDCLYQVKYCVECFNRLVKG